jgi:hypothetical protein
MRAVEGTGELAVASYELFSGTEVLGRMAMERMLAGLSTRRYPVGLEPVGQHTEQVAVSTSKSAVSLLRVDAKAIAAETKLDGKYLLRCSDPTLSPEDIALGYKQLLEVERGWRDMKQIIDLRPVYHRKEDRIRAHVVLCWLALLLIRIAETTTGDTWHNIRRHLDRLHIGTFTGPTGVFRQSTALTNTQRDLLATLHVAAPNRIVELAATR